MGTPLYGGRQWRFAPVVKPAARFLVGTALLLQTPAQARLLLRHKTQRTYISALAESSTRADGPGARALAGKHTLGDCNLLFAAGVVG